MAKKGAGGGQKAGKGGKKAGDEKGGPNGFRVPAIVVWPLCIGICWLFADWPGAIVGGVAGFFLWRSRA